MWVLELTAGTTRESQETFPCDHFWCVFVKVYSYIPVRNRNGDAPDPSDTAELRAALAQFLGSSSALAEPWGPNLVPSRAAIKKPEQTLENDTVSLQAMKGIDINSR